LGPPLSPMSEKVMTTKRWPSGRVIGRKLTSVEDRAVAAPDLPFARDFERISRNLSLTSTTAGGAHMA
jgi:hypothetical protein